MRLLARFVVAVSATAAIIGCSERVVDPPAVPDRPANLRVELVSTASVQISWDAVVVAEEGITYSVYRNEQKIGETADTEFVDTALVSNQLHVWYVTAKTSRGAVSAPSEPAMLATNDITPPRVVSTMPASAASSVSRLPALSVTFSEPMIPASFDMKALIVSRTTGGERVFGTVRYDQTTRTADFSPFAILPAFTSITVTVTAAAKDLAGNGVASSYTFTFTTGSEPSQLSPSAQPLLFSRRDGVGPGYDLFKANVEGTSTTNLSSHPAVDRDAAWSPDGRHVAFSSDRDGTYDIFVMREDGTGLQQLTSGDRDQTAPRWSSDARRIVFTSSRDGVPPAAGYSTPFDIWAMNADGSGQENLTRTPTAYEWWPHWSPDGTRLLFTRAEVNLNTSGNPAGTRTSIMIADSDAGGAVPLHPPDTAFVDDVASWSPDGTRIAFSVQKWNLDVFSELWLIFSIRPDGTDMKRITNSGSRRNPAWSPDGSELLVSLSGFNEFWGRFGEIAVVRLNLATLVTTTVVPHRPGAEVMSPQAWRR